MCDYRNRVSELNTLLSAASEDAAASSITALASGIRNLENLGEQTYSALVDHIERASATNLGTQRRWEDTIASAKADISRLFGDTAKDHELSAPLQLFWYQALEHEMALLDGLAKIKTPQFHDDLLVHQDTLNKMLGDLWDKWTFLLSQDTSLETEQRRVVQEVSEMAREIVDDLDTLPKKTQDTVLSTLSPVVSKIVDTNRELSGLVFELAKKVLERFGIDIPEGIDDKIEQLSDKLQLFAEYYRAKIQIYRNFVATYRILVETEKSSVLLLFNETRKDVDRYLDTNNIDEARELLNQARGSISDWASNVPTTGQRSDASAFRDRITSLVEVDWKLTEELNAKFQDKFKGIFVSSLSSETIEQLADKYLFQQHLEDVKRRGASAKAKDIAGRLERDVESAVDQALRPVDDSVSGVSDEVRELARLTSKEFKEYVRTHVREHIVTLLPVIEELQTMLEPSSLDRDFSRDDLERAIT